MKRRLPRGISCSRGFTLLEMLISLVITGMIILIIFGAMRLGVNAWDKGEKDISSQKRTTIIRQALRSQISSISTQKISLKDIDTLTGKLNMSPEVFFLKGTDEYVEFVSAYSLISPVDPSAYSHTNLSYVRYGFDLNNDGTRSIVLYEKKFSFFESRTQIDDMIVNDQLEGHTLIDSITEFTIQYLKINSDGETEWQDSWQVSSDIDTDSLSVDAVDTKFPLAVKLSFLSNHDKIEINARIISEPISEQVED